MRFCPLAAFGLVLTLTTTSAAFWSTSKAAKPRAAEIEVEIDGKSEFRRVFDNSFYKESPGSAETPLVIPDSSYLHTKLMTGEDLLIKASSHYNLPSQCRSVEFTNLPEPNPSPFFKGAVFHLLKDPISDHFFYSNGGEFLSFAPNDQQGTWIIGNKPGEDSGYIYLKPDTPSLSPVGLEDKDVSWYWLNNGKWVAQPQVRLVCVDEEAVSQEGFYDIEYFDIHTQEYLRSVLVPASGSIGNTLVGGAPAAVILDKEKGTWVGLASVRVLATMGGPSFVSDESTAESPKAIAHLVNEELANDGFRLTFRFGVGFNATWRQEASAIYSNRGPLTSTRIDSLSADQQRVYTQYSHRALDGMRAGDYLWLWYKPGKPSAGFTPSVATYELIDENLRRSRHDEMLLECVGASETTLLFKYYPSDRLKTMRQPVLHRDATFVTINRQSAADGSLDLSVSIDGFPLAVIGMIPLGSSLVSVVQAYLKEKDGALGGMSSCYLYHAAVSMPRPLVYAAEILCVLNGAKPLTMIQYTTPTDHQWKFPIVRELVQQIAVAKKLHPEEVEVDLFTTAYENDRTLIIYRKERKYLMDMLIPKDGGQALHPAPYPDRANPYPDYQAQIYNAYWNGIVLGYPERFVESYCLSFHNALTQEEKQEQVNLARRDIARHFALKQLSQVMIGTGLDSPVGEAVWNQIRGL